ncbi:MAG: DUF2461 domain-containing protein [Bacteroidetes bacterium]|nr:DUF2461 domain-containing protein [Bacteroidota bacterium]
MDGKMILDFLKALSMNNKREWFLENKPVFERARKDFESFINVLIPEIYKFDNSIGLLTAKDCLFRIFRDIRFSNDKTPYKTNFGAFIARGGRKGIYPGYYIHLESGQSMLAGGIYMPQPEVQKAVRQEIYYNIEEFKSILEADDFMKYFGKLDDFDKMKKPPKEFPADFKDIDLLKYRSYTIVHNIADGQVQDKSYFNNALVVLKAMHPLNTFLNRAIGG